LQALRVWRLSDEQEEELSIGLESLSIHVNKDKDSKQEANKSDGNEASNSTKDKEQEENESDEDEASSNAKDNRQQTGGQ